MPKLPDDLFVKDRRPQNEKHDAGAHHWRTLGLMALPAALFFALI